MIARFVIIPAPPFIFFQYMCREFAPLVIFRVVKDCFGSPSKWWWMAHFHGVKLRNYLLQARESERASERSDLWSEVVTLSVIPDLSGLIIKKWRFLDRIFSLKISWNVNNHQPWVSTFPKEKRKQKCLVYDFSCIKTKDAARNALLVFLKYLGFFPGP